MGGQRLVPLFGNQFGPEEHQSDGVLVRTQASLLALLAHRVADHFGQLILDGQRQLEFVDDAGHHLLGRRALQGLDRQRFEFRRQGTHVHLTMTNTGNDMSATFVSLEIGNTAKDSGGRRGGRMTAEADCSDDSSRYNPT